MQSVLIVDDEKHTRDGLAAVLSDDYDVLAAANADEAIKLMDETMTRFEKILEGIRE